MTDVNQATSMPFIQIVTDGFHCYYQAFEEWTYGAKKRFESRQWKEQRLALRERADLLERLMAQTTFQLESLLAAHPGELESSLRVLQKTFLAHRTDAERPMAQCFWQALLPQLLPASWHEQFVEPCSALPATPLLLHRYTGEGALPVLVQRLLADIHFEASFADLEEDALWISQQLLANHGTTEDITISVFPSLFYRNQHAYLLGAIHLGQESLPLAIAFIHPEDGIKVDAVLLSESAVKALFAFSRSYFMVEVADPFGLIRFLHLLLPSKPLEQLFINVGLVQYGKALLHYRLLQHLSQKQEKFTYAPGVPGMVMLVFTLPTFPVVIKILRNYFKPPKTVSREEVIEKYHFIARHDRVGRLADAQRFTSLVLPAEAFEPGLLQELACEADQSVRIEDGKVMLSLAYLERKMIPLDVFLREAALEEAIEVILDYGQAVREIAMSNVFPGDLLLKNFGVTPERRVVFYDYDETVPLTACNFRSIPAPRYEEDMLDAEPWFAVGENDIFPEELGTFLIPAGPLKDAFYQVHHDLFTSQFWNGWKTFFQSGGITDLAPYGNGRALMSRQVTP